MRRADAHRARSHARGQRITILLGSREHGLDAELAAGAHDAHGDLAAIRHQDAADAQRDSRASTSSSVSPYSTSVPSRARISRTRPRVPARTAFMSFMTSMIPTTVSGSTPAPTSTNGAAPGLGAR